MISQRYARMRVDRAKICGASTRAVSKSRGDRQEGCYLYILLPNESDATRRYIIITIAAPHHRSQTKLFLSCPLQSIATLRKHKFESRLTFADPFKPACPEFSHETQFLSRPMTIN
jgi:hypothetical protein